MVSIHKAYNDDVSLHVNLQLWRPGVQRPAGDQRSLATGAQGKVIICLVVCLFVFVYFVSCLRHRSTWTAGGGSLDSSPTVLHIPATKHNVQLSMGKVYVGEGRRTRRNKVSWLDMQVLKPKDAGRRSSLWKKCVVWCVLGVIFSIRSLRTFHMGHIRCWFSTLFFCWWKTYSVLQLSKVDKIFTNLTQTLHRILT